MTLLLVVGMVLAVDSAILCCYWTWRALRETRLRVADLERRMREQL